MGVVMETTSQVVGVLFQCLNILVGQLRGDCFVKERRNTFMFSFDLELTSCLQQTNH